MRHQFLLCLALPCTALLLAASCFADSIYTWTDEQGRMHFSTRKSDSRASLAELPDINKIEFPPIEPPKVRSCASHGGIDCSAGPDTDGSVICYDGFRGASAPFRLHCLSARLEVSEVSTPNRDGSFQVFLRNNSAILAQDVELSYTMRDGNTFLLQGPREVSEHGFAEFEFSPSLDVPFIEKEIKLHQLEVRCANCP